MKESLARLLNLHFPQRLHIILRPCGCEFKGKAGGCNNSSCCKQRFSRASPWIPFQKLLLSKAFESHQGSTTLPAAPTRQPLLTSLLGLPARLATALGRGPAKAPGQARGQGTHPAGKHPDCCSQWKVSAQDTCTRATELLQREKEVLHFYMNPENKWSTIEAGGLEQSRQGMNTPSAPTLRIFPLTRQQGNLRPGRKTVETVTGFREPLFCHLRCENLSWLTTKRVELRGSFPFSLLLSLCSNVNKS